MTEPNADYALVAEIYLEAVSAGDPPTKAVAETLAIKRPAATKLVLAARRAGLIPPANGTRPWVSRRCPMCGADRSRWRREPPNADSVRCGLCCGTGTDALGDGPCPACAGYGYLPNPVRPRPPR